MDAPRFYEQSSLLVRAYDALYPTDMPGTPGSADVQFYRSLAEEAGSPVLELGCGTGRVALPLASAGFRVVGLDRSPPMLEIAEQKRQAASAEARGRLELVQGDMTDFDLQRAFRLVVIAGRSFMSLLTVEAQRSCLGAIHRHLEPGGLLTIAVFDPRLDLCLPEPAGEYPSPRGEGRLAESGNSVEVFAIERRNDPLRQVLVEIWRLTERGADGSVVAEEAEKLELRWTYRYELHHLLELAGFDLVAEYSDFDSSPPVYASELVVVARRRGGTG